MPEPEPEYPGPEGRALTIGIRPEHVVLASGGVKLGIDLVEPLGSETLVHGTIPGGEKMSLKLPGGPPPSDPIEIMLPAAYLHVFDETGRRLEPVPAG